MYEDPISERTRSVVLRVQSGGTQPVRISKKLVIISVVNASVLTLSGRGVQECTYTLQWPCKMVKTFLKFLTYLSAFPNKGGIM